MGIGENAGIDLVRIVVFVNTCGSLMPACCEARYHRCKQGESKPEATSKRRMHKDLKAKENKTGKFREIMPDK